MLTALFLSNILCAISVSASFKKSYNCTERFDALENLTLHSLQNYVNHKNIDHLYRLVPVVKEPSVP